MQTKIWFTAGIIVIFSSLAILSVHTSSAESISSISEDHDRSKINSGERVTFTSTDGVSLVGSYYNPKVGLNISTPTVILLHMLGMNRSTWNNFSQVLSDNGYGVLSVDLRGHGESTRQANGTISYQSFNQTNFKDMTLDVAAVKRYLIEKQNANANKIAIIGASIGANLALNYAASDQSIRSVILLSPGLNYKGISTMQAIMEYKNPIYIIASDGDLESAKDSKILCKKITCAENVRIFEKSSSHGTDMLTNKIIGPKLTALIRSWLDSTFEPQD